MLEFWIIQCKVFLCLLNFVLYHSQIDTIAPKHCFLLNEACLISCYDENFQGSVEAFYARRTQVFQGQGRETLTVCCDLFAKHPTHNIACIWATRMLLCIQYKLLLENQIFVSVWVISLITAGQEWLVDCCLLYISLIFDWEWWDETEKWLAEF